MQLAALICLMQAVQAVPYQLVPCLPTCALPTNALHCHHRACRAVLQAAYQQLPGLSQQLYLSAMSQVACLPADTYIQSNPNDRTASVSLHLTSRPHSPAVPPPLLLIPPPSAQPEQHPHSPHPVHC